MTLAIDTDKAIQALMGAGFKKAQARVMIEQLVPASDDLVTKDALRAEIHKLKSDLITWMVGLHVASLSLIFALINSL